MSGISVDTEAVKSVFSSFFGSSEQTKYVSTRPRDKDERPPPKKLGAEREWSVDEHEKALQNEDRKKGNRSRSGSQKYMAFVR